MIQEDEHFEIPFEDILEANKKVKNVIIRICLNV